MAKFIQRAEWVEQVSYELVFDYIDEPNRGFRFPCGPQGQVNPLPDLIAASYAKCLANSHERPVVCKGVMSYRTRHRVPARIECGCGKPLALTDAMTNECGCGRFYNGSGQELCHPRHWGEETGEHFDDHGRYIG